MKLGQLIEYNMGNTYLEKSYTKCSGETILRPFPEKPKLSISVDQQSKLLYSLFLLYFKFRLTKYIESNQQTTYKAFIKNKKFWN